MAGRARDLILGGVEETPAAAEQPAVQTGQQETETQTGAQAVPQPAAQPQNTAVAAADATDSGQAVPQDAVSAGRAARGIEETAGETAQPQTTALGAAQDSTQPAPAATEDSDVKTIDNPLPQGAEDAVAKGRAARGVEETPAATEDSAENAAAGNGTEDGKPKRKTFKEMWREMWNDGKDDDELLTPEEKKKRKRERIISAIGDGISAFSNLYFTGKGALDSHATKTASEATGDRWDKIAKERESKRKEYYNGLMKAQQLDDERDYTEWNKKRAEGKDKEAAEWKKTEQERKGKIADAQAKRYEALAAKDEAGAKYWEAYTAAKESGASDASAVAAAKTAMYYAKADYERRRPATGGKGSGGGKGKYSLYNPETGKTEYFSNVQSRDQRAGELGYDVTPDEKQTTTGYDSNFNKTSTTKGGTGISGKLGKQEREKKAARKASGDGNGNFSGVELAGISLREY
jgi:hypothetical protein